MENSDEDKLIINGELFLFIRMYLRQKKPCVEIITKIEEILKNGADINACDNNDSNNTILHIAAQKDEKDLVIYLLQNGAHIFSNKHGKTAVHLALQNDTTIGKEIAEILTKEGKPAARVTCKIPSKQQTETVLSRQNSIISTVGDQEFTYAKRTGTSGVSGQFYETKLLSLVVHRALHDEDIDNFYVAANISDIGDFDDVCFRYGNVACFMQTKHRENTDKAKLTVASVRSNTGKLGLGIYFDSFLKIRQKYSATSSDPMFQGKFESVDTYFILYTPLKESFERKLLGNKPICSKLHNIIYTSETDENKSTDIFQFDFEDHDLDLLTRFIKQKDIKVLGKTFLEFILSDKKLNVMMTNDLIKMYHPALAQKVILISKRLQPLNAAKSSKNPNASNPVNGSSIPNIIHMGQFRPEFFYSEDYNLITLKDTFYKEIVFTHSPKTSLSKDEVKQKIKEIEMCPCAETISKLIGSPIKFDETNDKLILDISRLPKNKYKQDEIQQIKYDLQKIQVTRAMVRDAVYLAGHKKLMALSFQLPQSFGNIDLSTNQKTEEGIQARLDFLAGKFNSLINHFAEKNKNKHAKIIVISSDVVGPGKILELTHLNSNGGIGGSVGNLLQFDTKREVFVFNDKTALERNARYVLEKLEEMTEEDLTNYSIKVSTDGFPRVSFDVHSYDKNIAAEFLSKLWFYTNQAQEEAVEKTLKNEINTHYNADKQRNQFLFHVHSDAIFLRFHDEIQKWWKKQVDAQYITKSTTIFEKAKKDVLDRPLLTVLNVMFIRNIKKLGIEFKSNAIDCLNLDELMSKNANKPVNIVSDAVVLSAAKLMQSSEHHNTRTFINLDYIHMLPQNDYETMMEELTEIKDVTYVIVSETPLSEGLIDTLLKILTAVTSNPITLNRKIIVISIEPLETVNRHVFKKFNYITLKDNNINFIDLTSKSQALFLDKSNITYQGQEIKLNTVVDDNSKEFINAKLLWSLLNKEKLEIGHTLETHKYNEIKNYYINRNLKYDGEEYPINTLDDLDDKIVLISSMPCMGKSTLLTHLSLETKKIDPKCWIVRINMSAHDKDFQNITSENIKTVMIYLGKAALKNPDVIKKVNFVEIDKETVSINSKDADNVPFELELFIHFYNNGNIIFLFDGFDKVYANNTYEGLKLFSTLERANKRMWITSDCYVIKFLEREFGSSYKLERLSTIQQKSFLERFWTTNLKLEKLNHDQINNITLFCNYILKAFNRELRLTDDIEGRPIMPLLSVPLHILYLTVLNHFKNEAHNLSPCYFREIIKKKWKLNSYTAIDRFLRSDKEESLELAGTPLHMYIAANYFVFQITDKFDLHINTKMIIDRSNVYINAVVLYERCLKANIKKLCEIENKAAAGKEQDKLRDDFFENHKKLALYAICKESDITKFLTEPEIRDVKNTIRKLESGEIKTDLIDSVVDGVPRFYHLIFAEYFIVETLSDILKRAKSGHFDDKLESLWDFLVNVILVSSPPGLRNAFEYKLKYDPELRDVARDDKCSKVMFKLLLKPNQTTDREGCDNALDVAINEGLVNITNFLMKGVQRNINEDNINNFMTILKSSATILATADKSRSIVSENVLSCIQSINGETIIAALNTNELGKEIQENIKSNIVKPVKKITEKLVEMSGNNENLVALVERFPYHLNDFLRQFGNKSNSK